MLAALVCATTRPPIYARTAAAAVCCAPAATTATTTSKAILFDADGTLLNSLGPHVAFCQKLSDELDLGLELPDPTNVVASRKIAAAPMSNFFRRAGFPESTIDNCVEAYEARFKDEFPVQPFDGVMNLMERLDGWEDACCGIISSNTAENVRRALGPELCARFDFIDGIDNAPQDKADAIAAALSRLEAATDAPDGIEDAVYVGDTYKDFIKASVVGVQFVGIDYGFEPLGKMTALNPDALGGSPVARSVGDLSTLLTRWRDGEAL